MSAHSIRPQAAGLAPATPQDQRPAVLIPNRKLSRAMEFAGRSRRIFPTLCAKRSAPAWLGCLLLFLGSADTRGQVGTKLWEFRANHRLGPAAALDAEGTLYVGTANDLAASNQLLAIRKDGSLKWSRSLPGAMIGMPVIGPDGKIHVALNRYVSSPGPDGTVNVSTSVTSVSAVSPAGTVLWTTTMPASQGGFLGVAKSGIIYMANHWLISALAADGSILWTNAYARLPNYGSYTSPTIKDDGTIIVAGGDRLVALDPTGATLWAVPTPSGSWSSPAIGSDGAVYVGRSTIGSAREYGGRICAFNPNGTLRWEFPTEGVVSSSPIIGHDGGIYAACSDGQLYALHADGTLNWVYPTGSKALGAPVVDANEGVYFQTANRQVHALNSRGVLQWAFQVAYAPPEFSPALSADGVLIVAGSGNGRLYALQAGAGLSASPWPTFQGDSERSGQINLPTALPPAGTGPKITVEPLDQRVSAGTPLLLEASVESIDSVTYQWRREGFDIRGATNRVLSIPGATLADAGRYALIARNQAGSVSSRLAEVAVIPNLSAPARPLELRGWNQDVVIENKSAPASFAFEVIPGNTLNDPFGARFFESGLSNRATGLPSARQFPSQVHADILFALQPYESNNVLKLYWTNHTATLTLAQPDRYASLHVLAASAVAGGGNGKLALHFADGSSVSDIWFAAQNWFASSAKMALFGLQAAQPSGDSLEFLVRQSTAALHQTDLDLVALGLANRVLTAVTFTKPVAADPSLVTGIFAVSGVTIAEANLPRIQLRHAAGTGEIELILHNAGPASKIEVSTDCVEWSVFSNPLPQTATGRLIDPDAPRHPRRFYRIAP